MSDSGQQQEAEPQWPEKGDEWSDGEEGTGMDCGLLQAMAEEDEEINVYNVETFGMDLDTSVIPDNRSSSLQFGVPPPPTKPPPTKPPPTKPPPTKPPPTKPLPDPKPSCPRSAPFPPKQIPQYLPRLPPGHRGRGRVWRAGLGRGQMFEDPAVMRTVEGRQSIKSLDSAIVDCGNAMYQHIFDDDRMTPSYSKTRRISGSILQDNAIVCVIGHREKGQQLNSSFLDSPYPVSSFGFRRGEPRGSYSRRQFGQRGPSRMLAPMLPASPIFSRQPLTPHQHYNQVPIHSRCAIDLERQTALLAQKQSYVLLQTWLATKAVCISASVLVQLPASLNWGHANHHLPQTRGFMFPLNRPCPSTPQSLAPKMMQLRFGANSPRPSPFYSPSSNLVQPFSPSVTSRYPGPVTQLHPQHKRLLSQKQRIFQRKLEGWDPYCNFMTPKEKEWITRLQMIQLQSENPYLEDYYYQEYYRRLEAKMADEELGIRSKREPPKLTTPYITKTDAYTPVVHIEGSLGQVAVSTCYSPRRAISAVNAVQVQGPLEEQNDTRQQRLEVLGKIEKLFIVLLEVEETERTKTTVLSEAEERRLMEKIQRKVEHIYSQLQHHISTDSGEEFLPFLLVSKGKKLLARLLMFLNRDSALTILRIVTSNLPTLMSRDTEEALPVLYPSLRHVIGGLTFSQLIGVLKDLTSSESLTTHECLTLACQNKFGLSLLYALLSQGEKLLSSGVPLEPSIGDFETWTDTIFQVAGQLSKCSLVEPLLLPSNLLTLFCRYLDKRTVHQLKSNMESATGFLALPS